MLEVHSKAASRFERRTNETPQREPTAQGHAIYGPAANSNSRPTDPGLNNVNRVSRFGLVAKRGLDIIAAIAGLFIFSPMFLLVSLAVELSSGGSFFAHELRRGFNNRHISVLKFRIGTEAENYEGIINCILRSTGIEGLPQLINVLRGELSIVGPDPFIIVPAKDFEQQISPILQSVKPGITGWAQVNGYWGENDNLEAMRHRLELDRFYVENWSLLFDMKIIVMTMFSRLAKPQAAGDPR